MKKAIVLTGLALGGCTSDLTGGGGINMASMRSADAVPFAEIVQNIRCDVSAFLMNNNKVETFSIGGLIVAKTTKDIGNTVSADAAIPVASSISVALGASRSNGQAFGLEDTQAIVVYREEPTPGKPPAEWIDCSAQNGDQTAKTAAGLKLSGPLLNLSDRRTQMEAMPSGNPRLRLPGFRLKGSIYLVKNKTTGGKIQVFIFSGGAETVTNSAYRIDFDLATNWKPIIKDYEIEPPKASVPPPPNIVYVIQGAKPPTATSTQDSGDRGPIPPFIPDTVIKPMYKILPNGTVILGQQSLEAQSESARREADPSAPQRDVAR